MRTKFTGSLICVIFSALNHVFFAQSSNGQDVRRHAEEAIRQIQRDSDLTQQHMNEALNGWSVGWKRWEEGRKQDRLRAQQRLEMNQRVDRWERLRQQQEREWEDLEESVAAERRERAMAEANKLLLQAIGQIEKEEWSNAERTLSEIEELRVTPPVEFNFYFAKVEFNRKIWDLAERYIQQFIKNASREDAHYSQALALAREIDKKLSEERRLEQERQARIAQETAVAERVAELNAQGQSEEARTTLKKFLQENPKVFEGEREIFEAVVANAATWAAAMSGANKSAEALQCVNRLNQIGAALRIWSRDNDDRFPFEVSQSDGGTSDLRQSGENGFDANAHVHFKIISAEFSNPSVLICPSDSFKKPAPDFQSLKLANVTYELRTGQNVTAGEANPREVLARCPIHLNLLFCDGTVKKVEK